MLNSSRYIHWSWNEIYTPHRNIRNVYELLMNSNFEKRKKKRKKWKSKKWSIQNWNQNRNEKCRKFDWNSYWNLKLRKTKIETYSLFQFRSLYGQLWRSISIHQVISFGQFLVILVDKDENQSTKSSARNSQFWSTSNDSSWKRKTGRSTGTLKDRTFSRSSIHTDYSLVWVKGIASYTSRSIVHYLMNWWKLN